MNPTPEEMIAWIDQQAKLGQGVKIQFGRTTERYEVGHSIYWFTGKTLEEAIAAAMKESAK